MIETVITVKKKIPIYRQSWNVSCPTKTLRRKCFIIGDDRRITWYCTKGNEMISFLRIGNKLHKMSKCTQTNFIWYAHKAIMSQSYFNGPTTQSLNLQILYFSFLPVMEPLRAGWLFDFFFFLCTQQPNIALPSSSVFVFNNFIFYLLCFLLLWLNLCLVSK